MIVVSVSTKGIKMDGHAEYDKKGRDIVCSAVTSLIFTLIRSLEALTEDQIKYQEDTPGHINIEFKNLSEQGRLLVDSFFIGISEIVNSYGNEHVSIR